MTGATADQVLKEARRRPGAADSTPVGFAMVGLTSPSDATIINARGRNRTGTTLKSRDFLATSAFAADRSRGRSWSGARLHHGRNALGARRLLSTPSGHPRGRLGSALARLSARAFADFDGFHSAGFPAEAQIFKSLVSTSFTTRAWSYPPTPISADGGANASTSRHRPDRPPLTFAAAAEHIRPYTRALPAGLRSGWHRCGVFTGRRPARSRRG